MTDKMIKPFNSFLLLCFVFVLNSCGGGRDEPSKPVIDTTVRGVILLTPTANQLCEGLPVIFTWQSAEHAVKYNLIVSKVENGQETIVLNRETTGTSLAITDLERGKLYKWKVEATGPKNTAVSTVQQFQTESVALTNHPPFAPQLATPGEGSVYSIASGAKFSWTATDPDNDALSYDIYLSQNGTDFQLVKAAQQTNEYIFTGLEANKTYYWRVVVIDSKGNKTIGQKWSFNTAP